MSTGIRVPRRVVLDLNKLRDLHSGLGQFCKHLGEAVARLAEDPIRPVFHLSREHSDRIQAASIERVFARPYRRENVFRFFRPFVQPFVSRDPYAVWHATDQYCPYLPLHPDVDVVLTIHDLNFLREKSPRKAAKYRNRVQARTDRASVVTAISHFAAREISEHIDLKGKTVRVIHNGATFDKLETARRPSFAPNRKFLFALAAIYPRKNFHVLIDLIEQLPDYDLVIAGNDSRPYAKQIKESVIEKDLGARIVMPGEITDEERCWLYAHCEAFCFPSLTEGFGLPVLEAMAHGKPVFISDRTSLPEVGGDLAFYWKSFDPRSMVEVFYRGMKTFEKDGSYPSRLTAHAARFTWDGAAKQYLEIYEELIRAQGP